MPHADAIVVLTTVANEDGAVRLVRGLLDRKLIACGELHPSRTPEFLALSVDGGLERDLGRIAGETSPSLT